MRYVLLPLTCLLAFGISARTAAQDDLGAGSPRLVDEVAGLRASVGELVDLLDRLMSYQKTDLMLKRIELRQRQLEPLERELRDRKGEVESRQEEMDQLEVIREQLESSIDDDIRAGIDTPESENRRFEKEIDTRREIIEQRLADLEQKILELENDLAGRLDEIEDLEDRLDDLLDE